MCRLCELVTSEFACTCTYIYTSDTCQTNARACDRWQMPEHMAEKTKEKQIQRLLCNLSNLCEKRWLHEAKSREAEREEIMKKKTQNHLMEKYSCACLLTCLPACLPACLSVCMPACLPACLPARFYCCCPSCCCCKQQAAVGRHP